MNVNSFPYLILNVTSFFHPRLPNTWNPFHKHNSSNPTNPHLHSSLQIHPSLNPQAALPPPGLEGIPKSLQRLQERLLLNEFILCDAQVGMNRQSMRNIAKEVDLPALAALGQNILGIVTEVGGEDGVDLYERVR